ncbi:MAG: VOC family protein [Thiolinea sp.]
MNESNMKLSGIHHVAYRCKDAKETVEWYEKYLNMEYKLAFAEDHVPSTGAYDPYMHVFLDAGNGNVLAFFELPQQPEMGRDENTPAWVQHLAFKVESMDDLINTKAKLEADGIEVIGPTNHTLFKSIYFFDPNGHRLELAVDTNTPEMDARVDAVKWDMLNEWAQTKKAPRHAQWMHDGNHDE